MNLSDITIIIPSYGRPKYAYRALKYWAQFEVDLHLVDGSDNPITNISETIKNPKTRYHHINILSEVDRIKKILPLIKTKYTILSADDDFLLPESLSKCLAEIKKEDDIISCYGQTLSFYKYENTTKFFYTDYKLNNYKNISDNANERINKRMKDYVPSIIYSLMPTDIFKNIFDVEDFHKFKFYASLELRATLLVDYYGKSKTINDLLVLRNKDESPAKGRNNKNISFFRSLFLTNKKNFINDLIKSIKKRKNQNDRILKKTFVSAFRKYLFYTFKMFFLKRLKTLIINNISILFFRERTANSKKHIDLNKLNFYCIEKNINLNKNDYDLIKNIFTIQK